MFGQIKFWVDLIWGFMKVGDLLLVCLKVEELELDIFWSK